MNHILLKELKDAGYPQQRAKGLINNYLHHPTEGRVFVPTLSELIEACKPTRLFFLTPKDVAGEVSGWACIDRNLPRQIGATPEEAVVRFLIALYKNEAL